MDWLRPSVTTVDVSISELIGSVGVFLLLAAYFLNLYGLIDHRSAAYRAVNVLGAGLSAYASYLIEFVPFVVLEGTWMVVSLAALVRGAASGSGNGETGAVV